MDSDISNGGFQWLNTPRKLSNTAFPLTIISSKLHGGSIGRESQSQGSSGGTERSSSLLEGWESTHNLCRGTLRTGNTALLGERCFHALTSSHYNGFKCWIEKLIKQVERIWLNHNPLDSCLCISRSQGYSRFILQHSRSLLWSSLISLFIHIHTPAFLLTYLSLSLILKLDVLFYLLLKFNRIRPSIRILLCLEIIHRHAKLAQHHISQILQLPHHLILQFLSPQHHCRLYSLHC